MAMDTDRELPEEFRYVTREHSLVGFGAHDLGHGSNPDDMRMSGRGLLGPMPVVMEWRNIH